MKENEGSDYIVGTLVTFWLLFRLPEWFMYPFGNGLIITRLEAVPFRRDNVVAYLTTLIGALQVATGYVLGHYFMKSKAENTKGGITYDAAAINNFSNNDL